MFKVKIITLEGKYDDQNYYNHTQAFLRAMSLETSYCLPIIEERQWCSKNNMIATKTYYAKNKSIYLTTDVDTPIYSQLPFFTPEITYRLLIQSLLRKTISIYNYLNVKCPYSDEYFYSLTKPELEKLQYEMMNDPNLTTFYNDVMSYINEILDFLRLTDVSQVQFMYDIASIEPSKLIDTLINYKKKIKNFILRKVYGATYIEEYKL
jgi:hypothetical protein